MEQIKLIGIPWVRMNGSNSGTINRTKFKAKANSNHDLSKIPQIKFKGPNLTSLNFGDNIWTDLQAPQSSRKEKKRTSQPLGQTIGSSEDSLPSALDVAYDCLNNSPGWKAFSASTATMHITPSRMINSV